MTRIPRLLQRKQLARRSRAGFENCDLLNVLNADEETYADQELGMGDKTVKLLHGLNRERLAAFEGARIPADGRRERPTVAFVGAWGPRKGSQDAAEILAAVRARVPTAVFMFLGTGAPTAEVVAACGGDPGGIEVVPSFESDVLPRLLGGATVGILPSYVEGFPFSVIELLAAAAPVVAYDAPGARETIPRLDPTLLVPRGDPTAFGARVADVLELPTDAYRELSDRAAGIAASLRWEAIAAETIDVYRDRLEELRSMGCPSQ